MTRLTQPRSNYRHILMWANFILFTFLNPFRGFKRNIHTFSSFYDLNPSHGFKHIIHIFHSLHVLNPSRGFRHIISTFHFLESVLRIQTFHSCLSFLESVSRIQTFHSYLVDPYLLTDSFFILIVHTFHSYIVPSISWESHYPFHPHVHPLPNSYRHTCDNYHGLTNVICFLRTGQVRNSHTSSCLHVIIALCPK